MSIAQRIPQIVRQCCRQKSQSLYRFTCSQNLPQERSNNYHASAAQSRNRPREPSAMIDQQRLYSRARRRFSTSPVFMHGHLDPPKPGEEWAWLSPLLRRSLRSYRYDRRLHVTFIDKEGDEHKFEVAQGDNLLDIAQSEELEMEGVVTSRHEPPARWLFALGACGGSCACSTCHVIVESDEMYEKMAEPDDDENDMLDLAFGLTETSRLGCQVKMTKELDGLRIKLPSMTRNLQASDFSGAKKWWLQSDHLWYSEVVRRG